MTQKTTDWLLFFPFDAKRHQHVRVLGAVSCSFLLGKACFHKLQSIPVNVSESGSNTDTDWEKSLRRERCVFPKNPSDQEKELDIIVFFKKQRVKENNTVCFEKIKYKKYRKKFQKIILYYNTWYVGCASRSSSPFFLFAQRKYLNKKQKIAYFPSPHRYFFCSQVPKKEKKNRCALPFDRKRIGSINIWCSCSIGLPPRRRRCATRSLRRRLATWPVKSTATTDE